MWTKLKRLVPALVAAVILSGGMTVFIVLHYGYFDFALISYLDNVTVQFPEKVAGSYLIPQHINDVYLFKYSTGGRFFYSKSNPHTASYFEISPYYVYLMTEGEAGEHTCYRIVPGNNTLKRVDNGGYGKAYFIGYHLVKALLILLAFGIATFFLVRTISGNKKAAWIVTAVWCCYLIFMYCTMFLPLSLLFV